MQAVLLLEVDDRIGGGGIEGAVGLDVGVAELISTCWRLVMSLEVPTSGPRAEVL